MRLAITGLLSAVLLASSATADAAQLRGETGRGLRVRITTDDSGAAKRIVFHWWVHRCSRGRFNDQTLFRARGSKPPTHIRGGNPYRVKYRGGFSARIVAHVSGHRLSIYGWRGWFRATATLERHGHVLDRCRFRPQRWHATTPRVRLDFSGDDYIANRETYSLATPSTPFDIEVDEHGRSIVLFARGEHDFTFTVGAPFGHRLQRRRYRPASNWPTRRRASIGLSGDGRACGNDELGEFTITRVKFDRQGLVLVAGSFVHRCRYAAGESRGTFSYHR